MSANPALHRDAQKTTAQANSRRIASGNFD
jgi:hypothetical protein